MNALTENISEKRRGRPRVHLPWELVRLELGGRYTSNRGSQNAIFGGRTMRLILASNEPALRWLYDQQGYAAGRPGTFRRTILAELGRIKDDAELLEMARIICEYKPKVADAVRVLRDHRLDR